MFIYFFCVEENLDASVDDYNEKANISRKKIYSKFSDRSFNNVTSTPLKSPLNSVSILVLYKLYVYVDI